MQRIKVTVDTTEGTTLNRLPSPGEAKHQGRKTRTPTPPRSKTLKEGREITIKGEGRVKEKVRRGTNFSRRS